MNFFIKKNSTFPKLRYGLTEKLLNELEITDEMLTKCAVTFSMKDYETNRFKVANIGGEISKSERGHKYPYYLEFSFNSRHTNKVGVFLGEFTIDFFSDECTNKIKLPISEEIFIKISDSITNTLVS